jgi:hypothetical protein
MQIVLDLADEFKPVLDELTLLLRVVQAKVSEIRTAGAPDNGTIEREPAARMARTGSTIAIVTSSQPVAPREGRLRQPLTRRSSPARPQHHGHDSREHPDRDPDDQPEEQLHAERRAPDAGRHPRGDEGHTVDRRLHHERHPRGRPPRRGWRAQGGLAIRHRPSLSPAVPGGADRACETIVAARTT